MLFTIGTILAYILAALTIPLVIGMAFLICAFLKGDSFSDRSSDQEKKED
jgi:hypothetical protein